jgi:hypothetical protein
MGNNNKVAVVHLVWLPYGLGHLQTFITSYKKHPSSFSHDLYIIFNGVKDESELIPYKDYLSAQSISYGTLVFEKGQDLYVYRETAKQIGHDYILFLNSFTEFLGDNWLLFLMQAMNQGEVGIVGPTGSWQSHVTSVFYDHRVNWEFSKPFAHNFRKWKLFIKASAYWSFLFPSFPNPHIRTGSFFINRKLFLDYFTIQVRNKFDAYKVESGRNGINQKLLKKGLKLLIVDRDGKTWPPGSWPESNVFWISDQKQLLIADNQTRLYENSTPEVKKHLTFSAWGIKC